MLLIPMAPDYAPRLGLGAAWTGTRLAAGAVPLVLPAGDALDRSTLGPIDFESVSWDDVQPVASRAHAAQAALVWRSGLRRPDHREDAILSASLPQTLPPLDVPVAAGARRDQAYATAADAAAQAIGNAWKARSAIDFSQRSTLIAEVVVDSLAQWGAIQQKLARCRW